MQVIELLFVSEDGGDTGWHKLHHDWEMTHLKMVVRIAFDKYLGQVPYQVIDIMRLGFLSAVFLNFWGGRLLG